MSPAVADRADQRDDPDLADQPGPKHRRKPQRIARDKEIDHAKGEHEQADGAGIEAACGLEAEGPTIGWAEP